MEVYRLSEGFPRRDGVALTTQRRRASLSVPTNIAEGAGKFSEAEFRRFLEIALGSAAETHIICSSRVTSAFWIPHGTTRLPHKIAEVRRMLSGLIKRVTASRTSEPDVMPPFRSDSASPHLTIDGGTNSDNSGQPTA
ncbi:MAG: four helix bundle protein [Gemmatimonadota bacterium]|nr:four helix bundle protein [Gemmatimonadota bacterium]